MKQRKLECLIGVLILILGAWLVADLFAGPAYNYRDGNSYGSTNQPYEYRLCKNTNSQNDVQVVDVPTGKRLRLLYVLANAETAQTVIFESDDASSDTTIFGPFYIGATGGLNTGYVASGLAETDLGEDLLLDNASAVNTTVCIVYTLLPE